MNVYQPDQYPACATAALREAANRKEVVQRIRQETGLELNVIDGLEEARILAMVNNISLAKPHKYKMYIDVGGRLAMTKAEVVQRLRSAILPD